MRFSRSKKFWSLALLSGGALVAAGVATGRYRFAVPAESPSRSVAAPAASGVTAPQAPTRVLARRTSETWARGTKRVYAVDLSTTFEAGDEPTGATGFAAITLTGTLALTAVHTAPPRTLRAELSELTLAIGDGKSAPSEKSSGTIRQALAQAFYAELDPDGRVSRVHLARGLEAQAESLIKMLLAAGQLVVPAGAPADAWSVEESDTSGTFLAHYRRLSEDSFEKTKGEYRKLTAGEIFGRDRATARATGRISRVAGGELDHRELEDRIEMAMDKGSFVSTTRVGIRTVTARRLDRVTPPVLQGLVPSRLDELVGAMSAGVDPDRPAPGETVASVMRELGASEGSAAFHAQRRLVALLTQDPASAREVALRVRSGDAKARELGLGALANAATPEAQRELIGMARDTGAALELRDASLTNLALSKNITKDTFESLRTLSSDATLPPDLHSTATLALGAAVRSSGDGVDSGTSASAVNQLVQAFDAEPADGNQSLYMTALGNSGDPSAFPAIERALKSADIGVQVAAVSALRFIDDPRVDPLLVQILTTAQAALLRLEAVSTIGYRPITPLLAQAITTQVRKDADSDVRESLVALMSNRRSDLPNIADVMREIAASDPDPKVKETAARVLATLGQRA